MRKLAIYASGQTLLLYLIELLYLREVFIITVLFYQNKTQSLMLILYHRLSYIRLLIELDLGLAFR